MGAAALPGLEHPAPPTPFNVEIGPHRRYTWVDADLPLFKAIKDELGGTLNDVVLAAASLALGAHLRSKGQGTDGLVLKAMVPVSVRADAERGALGNKVAAMWASLPVGVKDAAQCYEQVRVSMAELKSSGQAVGAEVLTNLAGFAPPTILSQAARLQARQRYFNLVITNVPGPQFPLYLLGDELVALYPVVPLARKQALGIAVMSYNGRLGFGLLADYDALPELESLADDLRKAIAALARAAKQPTPRKRSVTSDGNAAATSKRKAASTATGGARSKANGSGARPASTKADGSGTRSASGKESGQAGRTKAAARRPATRS
jgi:WS/DGAT/MGAT family acyltransferase